MRFDTEREGWMPAHDRTVRLRSSFGLVVGLVLMAISAGALLAMPAKDAPRRHTVAAALP
jgi:hypothetical protein